jgi:hypothetical protein
MALAYQNSHLLGDSTNPAIIFRQVSGGLSEDALRANPPSPRIISCIIERIIPRISLRMSFGTMRLAVYTSAIPPPAASNPVATRLRVGVSIFPSPLQCSVPATL